MKNFLASIVCVIALSNMSLAHGTTNWFTPAKIAAAGALTCGAVYGAHYAYHKYVDYRIIEESVDAFYLGITLSSAVDKLPKLEREEVFRKKAHLINLRKRILIKLESIINEEKLSKEHLTALKKTLRNATAVFKVVDFVRRDNPYEEEYEKASDSDVFIEDSLIESIVLNHKPEDECSQEELLQQKKSADNQEIIYKKIKDRIKSEPMLTFPDSALKEMIKLTIL